MSKQTLAQDPEISTGETRNYSEKTFRDCRIVGKNYERGSAFVFDVHAANSPVAAEPSALYVLLERKIDVFVPMLTGFMEEGLIPWGLIIFCPCGWLNPSLPGGTPRRMRAEEFDQLGSEFSDFLIEELIPEACRLTGTKLSSSPDMHFIHGSSSGGMAAWNAVWFRNDYFRRAFLSSPTFSSYSEVL